MNKLLEYGPLGHFGFYKDSEINKVVKELNLLVDDYNKKINSFESEELRKIFISNFEHSKKQFLKQIQKMYNQIGDEITASTISLTKAQYEKLDIQNKEASKNNDYSKMITSSSREGILMKKYFQDNICNHQNVTTSGGTDICNTCGKQW